MIGTRRWKWERGYEEWGVGLTAPHPRTRDRSLPVPSGRTATGGKGLMASSSITESTHPTVPSPPHARIRTSLRSLNILRLERREMKTVVRWQTSCLLRWRK